MPGPSFLGAGPLQIDSASASYFLISPWSYGRMRATVPAAGLLPDAKTFTAPSTTLTFSRTSESNPPGGMPLLPKVGWNVETVIGVSNEDDTYNSSGVMAAHTEAAKARDHGLVNVVRLDWKSRRAVPPDGGHYISWRDNFNHAANDLKDVATIFVAGNEPTVEPGMTAQQYADAFNFLYPSRVVGTLYLATGPAPWSFFGTELDRTWLRNASNAITNLDGFQTSSAATRRPALPYEGGPAAGCQRRDACCPCGGVGSAPGVWPSRRRRMSRLLNYTPGSRSSGPMTRAALPRRRNLSMGMRHLPGDISVSPPLSPSRLVAAG